ncbi:hypothetical protein Sjap_010648 [Stephania japonica]|uniref:CASP-like protein n=1 Tax=Stephania japonica TaxID=461633 RepID=A0AAP0J9T8_9MAGN
MECIWSLEVQACLRFLCIAFLVTTACIVRVDSETKPIFGGLEKKATISDLPSLKTYVIVVSAVAGYHLIQLTLCLIRIRFEKKPRGFNKVMAWTSFFTDQIVSYVSFATTLAATQLAILAITGADEFEWLKLCNIYTRFCVQIGGGIFCSSVANFLMWSMASISGFNLFRFYSWTNFLALKTK